MRHRSSYSILLKDNDGVAALEFAIVLPVMLILMLSGIQLVLYVNAVRKVELLTASISEMISQAAPPASSQTALVTGQDIQFSMDSTLVIFPYVMKDAARQNIPWGQDISINYSSIQFTQIANATCTSQSDQSGCYLANVVWTSTGVSGYNYRPCITPQLAASNTAASSRYTLPQSVFGPGSIIAIDVIFTFTPTFGSGFIAPLKIARSVYVQPRYALLINYDTVNNNNGIASKCPGY